MKGLNIRENLNNSFISSDLVQKKKTFLQLMYIKPNHNKRNIKVLDVLGNHPFLYFKMTLFIVYFTLRTVMQSGSSFQNWG